MCDMLDNSSPGNACNLLSDLKYFILNTILLFFFPQTFILKFCGVNKYVGWQQVFGLGIFDCVSAPFTISD